MSNSSFTTEELSSCRRRYASSFSAGERNLASEADLGRYHKANNAQRTVPPPSMRNKYCHAASDPVFIRNTPKARRPENAEAMLCAA